MVSMTRSDAAQSNISQPGLQPWKYYEKMYTTSGPQEWITMPDCKKVGVVISFPSGPAAAFLEGTCSPYDAIQSLGGVNPIGAYSPILVPITDTVTDVTSLVTQGWTAIRINSLGGNVAISVRC